MILVANGCFSSQTCLQSVDRAEHREGRFDVSLCASPFHGHAMQ
jgi:hypothetical protein